VLASINPRGQSLKIFLVVVSDAHFTNHKIKKEKKNCTPAWGDLWVGEREMERIRNKKRVQWEREAFADGKNHCLL